VAAPALSAAAAGIGDEALARIRQSAFALPQVVKPADFLPEGSAGFERHLATLGYLLLQKSMPGARPSRWIEPRLVPAALAHLDAVGGGPEARLVMVRRQAELEAEGITRVAGRWQRRAAQPLRLDPPGWDLNVAFTVGQPEEPVWAYHRSGDLAALRASLGAPPPWPHGEALRAQLQRLVARSQALAPQHLASLLPRWQSECAQPQTLAELVSACTRAQDRWEHAATELDTLRGLHRELAFQGYPDSFAQARCAARRVSLFVGPPNSGKTHAAFERLAQALDGAYLAPLRLLALEGRDRLAAQGVPCSLLTGEENVPAADARVTSSTIEMVDTRTPVDVAVIDEAQMLFDASRGWAWTQAIVGVPASELIIICSAYAVPAVEALLGLCGERCTVRSFERKQHVELLPRPVTTNALRTGDAVVAFSRRDVLLLRDRIAAEGHAVSVIYGALPPEVRRREAERFAGGGSDILVATDAIGMGLNLPIRRVLFSTMNKFDGQGDRALEVGEVHQIAGRAGRFGIHEEGFVGVLKDAEPTALRLLKERLADTPRAPRSFKAPVAPSAWHVQTIAERLGKQRLHEVLAVFMQQLKLDDTHFAVAELEQMLLLAEQLDASASRLSLMQRFIYAQAPVDLRSDALVQDFLTWSHEHARHGRVSRPVFLDSVDGHSRLDRMEQALRACTLWLWLDLRFEGAYGQVEEVLALRSALNDGIERQLAGQRPLAQLRGGRRR
jgi:ATP-dependent RNA helicase SUPV3L1/SUV3